MTQALTLHGAAVVCYVNGKVFGRVQSFKYQINSNHKPIKAIDVLEAFELAPVDYSVSGTMTIVRTMGDGGAEGAGLIPRAEDLPAGKYFSLYLEDRVSKNIIFKSDHCVLQSQSWDASPKTLMIGQVTFSGLTYSNELEPQRAT